MYPALRGVTLVGFRAIDPREEVGVPRKGYPPEFRRKVLDLVEAGRPVREVGRDLGISDQTIYTWRKQDLIDKGQLPGVTTTEQAELLAARKRIRELETELSVTKRAIELVREVVREVVPPKGGSKRSRCWRAKVCRSRSPAGCWRCQSRATSPGEAGRPRRDRCGTHG
ncbi:hypothetical protein GCM10023178_04890 [Actinomadura luteofluorescens]